MKRGLLIAAAAAALLLAAYHALMFYDNNFRYGRMRETPAVKPHEEPLRLMPEGVVPVGGGEALYRADPTAAAPAAGAAAEGIARGRAVYFTFCAQCHGSAHDGRGTVGQSFMPLPTDLRSAAVQLKAPEALFTTVSYGIPGGRQPPLYSTVTAADRLAVVHYILSLGERP
jgi:mono/diheme cytochrome c family protein